MKTRTIKSIISAALEFNNIKNFKHHETIQAKVSLTLLSNTNGQTTKDLIIFLGRGRERIVNT